MTEQRPIIVAADDLEETGALALSRALDLAGALPDPMLHVVHVITEGEVAVTDAGARLVRIDHLLATLPERLWERVRTAGRGRLSHAISVSCHVRVGVPSDAILQIATDYEADFVVLGTHGRRGVLLQNAPRERSASRPARLHVGSWGASRSSLDSLSRAARFAAVLLA